MMDKGNISDKNWRLLDESGFGYVTSLPPSQYADISTRPLEEFSSCLVPDVGQMKCLRTRAKVAGKERTLIVLDSPSLRDGQLRGLNQQLQPVLFGLTHLEHSLLSANRRRRGEQIKRQIAKILKGVLAKRLLRYNLTEDKQRSGYWQFDWWIDMDAYRWLRDRIYGRRVLVSNHAAWQSCDLIWAYWGQSEAELVFRQMKDPEFLALRPQFHWTDQKICVHSFCCVVGYLLAALIRRHARQLGYTEGLRTDELVAKKISLVPEGRRVFPTMTVLENLQMGAYKRSNKISISQDTDMVLALFPRLKERLKQKAGTLSTGEQQMLAMGRALMLKPTLLLADEPSLGLSPNFVELIFDKLVEINKNGTSILLVEQNASEALRVAHRAYVFSIGEIVLQDNTKNLLTNDKIKKSFLGIS